jgi:hypothetical protein
VCAYSAPDDVGLPGPDDISIFKRGPAIASPRHLEDAWCSLNASDSQAVANLAAPFQVLDELPDGSLEPLPLIRSKPLPVTLKARGRFPCGHGGLIVERREKVLGRFEDATAAFPQLA